MKKLKVLDLFSGIGGFSLGLERVGFETAAFCEIEKYPRKILNNHWPTVPIAEDIKKLTYNRKTLQLFYKTKVIYVGTIQLICGGFPCQPFSVAGKQRGKEDNRHLWPEMLRIIKEVRPNWAIGENVAGFISMALDDVLFNLEDEGYETQSFVIPACAVGGIHRRDRVWIVANSNRCADRKQHQHEAGSQSNDSERKIYNVADTEGGGSVKPSITQPVERQINESRKENINHALSNTNDERLQGKQIAGGNEKVRQKPDDKQSIGCGSTQQFRPIEPPTEPAVRHRDDGLSDNVARLKALGNAVVPQIPEMIGRAIMSIENQ